METAGRAGLLPSGQGLDGSAGWWLQDIKASALGSGRGEWGQPETPTPALHRGLGFLGRKWRLKCLVEQGGQVMA